MTTEHTLDFILCLCCCVAGEKFWRLPLNPDLKCKLESPIADLKNYAGVVKLTRCSACSSSSKALERCLPCLNRPQLPLHNAPRRLTPWPVFYGLLEYRTVCLATSADLLCHAVLRWHNGAVQGGGEVPSLLRCSCRSSSTRAHNGHTWMLQGQPGTMQLACRPALVLLPCHNGLMVWHSSWHHSNMRRSSTRHAAQLILRNLSSQGQVDTKVEVVP